MSNGNVRSVLLPVEHLDAEFVAAPFAAAAARSHALVALDPWLRNAGTRALWREVERDLLGRFPGLTVDELVLRRDDAWFGGAPTATSLHELLARAASRFLDSSAADARPRSDGEGERSARWSWRWLTFALPPDLLLAAAGADAEAPALVSGPLGRHLEDRGVAEVHLHLKAAIDFPDLWASLLTVLAEPTTRPTLLASPGAEDDEGRQLGPVLLTAALVRLALGSWLRNHGSRPLQAYLDGVFRRSLRHRLGGGAELTFCTAVVALAAGTARGDFEAWRNLYRDLVGPPLVPDCLDPMRTWFPTLANRPPDFQFTQAAITALRRAPPDPLFAQLFWQCIRARVRFYRHVVQRPMTPGLQFFTRTYARLSAPRRPISLGRFVKNAVHLGGPAIRSLEVRLVPDADLGDLVTAIKAVDEAARKLTPTLEVGIVFHLSRTRGEAANSGLHPAANRDCNEDPGAATNSGGYRFGRYYRTQRAAAVTLANALVAWPNLLVRVRGLDLCTDELGVPSWVVRPLIRSLDAAGRAAVRAALRGYDAPQPLRLTVHAGEDFVHLLGGIRRVHEAIEVFELGDSSRIGHAVALGVDPDAWAGRTPRLSLPAGERMLDLLWSWRCAVQAPDPLRSWLPWIDQALTQVARTVFGEPITPPDLVDWWSLLHSDAGLRAAGFPDGPPPRRTPTSLGRVVAWLTDPGVFRRSQDQVPVDVGREIGLVGCLQRYVRGELASRGIVVEVNPSSNLLIGHLGDLEQHPLWRLCPPTGRAVNAPPVRVAIGSDDPVTFATSLPVEYQLLADALVAAGVGSHHALDWIESARSAGMSARFTLVARRDLWAHHRLVVAEPPP